MSDEERKDEPVSKRSLRRARRLERAAAQFRCADIGRSMDEPKQQEKAA